VVQDDNQLYGLRNALPIQVTGFYDDNGRLSDFSTLADNEGTPGDPQITYMTAKTRVVKVQFLDNNYDPPLKGIDVEYYTDADGNTAAAPIAEVRNSGAISSSDYVSFISIDWEALDAEPVPEEDMSGTIVSTDLYTGVAPLNDGYRYPSNTYLIEHLTFYWASLDYVFTILYQFSWCGQNTSNNPYQWN
jgi:hypothetical protein